MDKKASSTFGSLTTGRAPLVLIGAFLALLLVGATAITLPSRAFAINEDSAGAPDPNTELAPDDATSGLNTLDTSTPDPDAPDPDVPNGIRINAIDVSVTVPTVGATPDFGPIYTVDPDGAVITIEFFDWYRVDNYDKKHLVRVGSDYAFKAGETYAAVTKAVFDTSEYYYSKKNIVLTVNGQPADEHLSAREADYLGIAYTWELPADPVGPLDDDDPADNPPASNGGTNANGIPATGDSSLPLAVLSTLLVIAGACALAARKFAHR